MASTAGVHSPPQPGYASPPQQPYAAFLSGAQQQLYQQAAASVRPGTLPPGVCVKIGEHGVTIERFLSEGGFAHVYVVRSSRPIPSPGGSSEVLHVLKRVAVPDKPTLKEVRWEVDVMKLLRGHKHIVNLIEASAAPISGTTGYEVFILMEYCSGGGIIDMMNTRLQNRLSEAEILKIFSDVVEGVCWMHTRNPPLMHRDLKVENILLAGPDFYKVCDFGSSTTLKRPPQSMQEIQALEAELNKTTTLQYRAPEMCDVWARKEVGLPADVWALGVLLYKLCFYTTPFEEQGPLAILNVQYKMPSYPNYSQDIRNLIASMLVEPVNKRPTAWQVHQQVCRLRGVKPNKDYQQDTLQVHQIPSLTSLNGAVSPSFSSRPASGAGHIVTAPVTSDNRGVEKLPQDQLGVSPMRRGRPSKSGHSPSPSQPSNLQSEWHVPSHSASNTPSTHAGVSHHITAGSHNLYATQDTGFADSFAPPVAITLQDAHHNELVRSPEPTGTKTASATAAIFEELSTPGSTVRAQPTLASLAAVRSGQSAPAPASASGSRLHQFSQPSSRSFGSSQDLRRVSPGKPLGPRPVLPIPDATRVPSYTAKSANDLEEGTQTEKAVLSPPIKPPKPNLVSRASQTSPALLNDWKQKEIASTKGHLPSRALSSKNNDVPPAVAKTTGSTDLEELQDLQRFPSLDDWESTGFSPPAESLTTTTASPKSSSSGISRQAVNLLDEDPGGLGGHGPARSTSYNSRLPAMPSRQASATSASSTVAAEAPHLQSAIASGSGGFASLHDLQSDKASSSSSDSEGEEGPEEPTGHHYGTSTPTPPAEPSPKIVPPTLPSAENVFSSQRSPGRGPLILAPKPKRGGISSIVSAYESISTSDPSPSSSNSADFGKPNSLNKPTKPPKPNFTNPTRQSSLQSTAFLPNHTSTEEFSSRYPSVQSSEQTVRSPGTMQAALPPAGAKKNSSDRYFGQSHESESRARPQSMQFSSAQHSNPNHGRFEGSPSHITTQAQTVEEDDEAYQGVANLRDRWQKMQSSTGSADQHERSNGLSRRATTLASNRWDRS